VKCDAPTIMIRGGKEGRARVVDSSNARMLSSSWPKSEGQRLEAERLPVTRNGSRRHKFIQLSVSVDASRVLLGFICINPFYIHV